MWQEHLTHVTQVLETLRKNQVIANLQKCEFDNTSLKYIGHMIGAGDLRVDLENIAAITQWPIPTNIREVGSVMVETQYIRNKGTH